MPDSIYQFYVPPSNIGETEVQITGQEAIHASQVLRKSEGEEIYVTDGAGHRYRGSIVTIGKRELSVKIDEVMQFQKPEIEIVLALGVIKKRDRLEFAVEKATELGVSEIILFRADHSQSFNVRMDRIEASVLSAMKQSLRVFLPPVSMVDSLEEIIDTADDDIHLLYADPMGRRMDWKAPQSCRRLVMFVGPEGGFSKREKGLLDDQTAVRLHLGDYRLRAETAAVALAATYGNSDEERV
ncbi:MAG: RsmE family RNA methyltransferase [Bacteroidetes bacterium]|jgi:16S rRNA (uracil1498-N3)-methyltransferase|nr:RsmE family RNA methyltransferase [Bacteroidota bacterium]